MEAITTESESETARGLHEGNSERGQGVLLVMAAAEEEAVIEVAIEETGEGPRERPRTRETTSTLAVSREPSMLLC